MNKRCQGCGAILQSTNVNDLGYIPLSKKDDGKYCERCFKIINYNQKSVANLPHINDKLIKKVNNSDTNVFFLIDFLNLSKETIDIYNKINCKKYLLISKIDILPKSIKEDNIKEWLSNTYNIKDNVIFISTKNNKNVNFIISNLIKNKRKEAYIMGFANSGKSSLINKMCEIYDIKRDKITTSSIPNTTVDFMNIKIDNFNIIDSPGFVLKRYFFNNEEYDLMKRCSPKGEMKPITYQTKDKTSIIIEDRIRINSNIDNSFTLYMSNNLKIEKVFDNNNKLKDKEETILNIPTNSDLLINGLGFINIKKECKLKINGDIKDLIEVRKSIFK